MKALLDFKALKITLASPENIKEWSHGEITKPETINYRTLKPEKDGLFDERIFGPVKDWECYCGKYKRIRFRGIICEKCGVEVTQARVRRERMGHLSLSAPVVHSWFFRGAPSKLGLLLDISPRSLDAVIYFASYIVISLDPEKRKEDIEKLKTLQEKEIASAVKVLEEQIGAVKKESEAEVKEVKKTKEKSNLDLKVEEMELASRHKIALLRDAHSIELAKIEEKYKKLEKLMSSVKPLNLLSEEDYLTLDYLGVASFLKVGMGSEAIKTILENIDLDALVTDLRKELTEVSGIKHIKAAKRLRVAEGMRKADIDPTWMVLTVLPVLPPDLRPMVQLSGGRFATSDLNDLYRRVINRNNRLKKLIDLGAPEIILRNEKRMLQEAVDALIDTNSRSTTTRTTQAELRSLSDMLRGKQGRFRQNLLGKRVDYSGRSVIVVGPELDLDQVGIPKEMALEMFKPFVLRDLIGLGLAPNVKSAKHVLEKRPPEVWDILEEITREHPVLINRAPTLHKLGIQAFYPVLIEGDAIRIHPCICAGFNADFDGDQMAVHVPLSSDAQAEARRLMMASQNILRPADGTPITIPNKEMALGAYYITSIDEDAQPVDTIFVDSEEAIFAWQNGKIGMRQPIKVRMEDKVVETTVGRINFNRMLPDKIPFLNETFRNSTIKSTISAHLENLTEEELLKLIDNVKNIGFRFATVSGLSVSVFDNEIVPEKDEIIAEADKRVDEIEKKFDDGLITEAEKRRLTNDIWTETTDVVYQKTWAAIKNDNSVKMISDSGGSRASSDQIKQLSGMKGLVQDPSGKIVPLPTKSNFRQGLSVFEYFTSSRGARKGLADRALRTAESGYLTRRLVDVSHDVIIRQLDCGTKEGITVFKTDPARRAAFENRIIGMVLAKDVKGVAKAGDLLDLTTAKKVADSADEIIVRSPLTCEATIGLCALCYGRDTSTRKLVEIGTPVGVIAAQSIGEPGTQLTMRTFHTGGIVGTDITQGLPRVEELLEARTPKVSAPIAEITGKVTVDETAEGFVITIKGSEKPVTEKQYLLPLTEDLNITTGDTIKAGEPLSKGHLDVKEILRVKGLREAQKYIADEAQSVYEAQGVPIDDKHFEVIIRKMSEKVKITSSGDTKFLPGEHIAKHVYEYENAKTIAEGGEPATAELVILGITRASLYTESFLSAASFQETTNVLTQAASEGKVDPLLGMKENVIIGRLIPTSVDRAIVDNIPAEGEVDAA